MDNTTTPKIADRKREEKSKEKKYYVGEIISLLFFVGVSLVMFQFHELNHEECQAYLLAKDSSIAQLLFTLPHYQDSSPLFMLLLSCVAKIGIPAVISLRLISFPFSVAGAALIIFKGPFKRWINCLIPFMFFLFYEYTIICSYYSILFVSLIFLAYLHKNRKEKAVIYAVTLIIMGLCGLYGILFALGFGIIWTFENLKKNGEQVEKIEKLGFFLSIGTVVLLIFLILAFIPNKDSFFFTFVDHDHPIRNLIYTLFIMPSDAVVTDVDFFGLLQNTSEYFVNAKALAISAYLASIAIVISVLFISHIHRKKRYFILPFLLFAIPAALGCLYYYQIGAVVPFEICLLWMCFDDKTEKRELPKALKNINSANNNILIKVSYFILATCLGVSLVWSVFSCYNDAVHDVWYAKELNQVIDNYNLMEYHIVSDWYYRPILNGKILYQMNPEMFEELLVAQEEAEGIERESEEGYLLTYFVRQLNPEDFYQATTVLNFSDCLVYSESNENYISNLGQGKEVPRYNGYRFGDFESEKEASLSLGKDGYPDIIIGNPNIVGLMGLDAKNVRYFCIYELRTHNAYKMYSNYNNKQVFIRRDLYFDRDRWPYMDQVK